MTSYETVWRILTLHCDEASRLSSEALDHPLAAGDQVAWKVHLLLCAGCRSHRRDIVALRQAGRDLAQPTEPPGVILPNETRERIKRSLEGGDETTG